MDRKLQIIIIPICIVTIVVVLIFGINALKTATNGKLLLGAMIFIVSIAVGLIWKIILDLDDGYYKITLIEFIISGVIIGIIFSFLGVNVGWLIAWKSRVTFHEYWNGWEIEAVTVETVCSRNGPCVHEYNCDPYIVMVPYSCNCDDDGCDTCLRPEVRYHRCPYAKREYTHIIKTTLGDFVIDRNVFSENPQEWRSGNSIPDWVQWGPSVFWIEARNRCEAGRPGPVTTRESYENLLLASDATILNEYSDAIQGYLDRDLLPDVRKDVREYYYADKVYFVKYNPLDQESWQWKQALLNAALGSELQGDLHLVVVRDEYVSGNPDRYITALKAYWQNPETWGRDTVSKNSIILVIGTEDGQTISWARAITGMPSGNEGMIYALKAELEGAELSVDQIYGDIQGELYNDPETDEKVVRSVGNSGILRRVLWGMDDSYTRFNRVSMTAEDEDDTGSGFNYLSVEIKPKTSDQIMILFFTLFLSMVVWPIVAYVTE